MNLDLSEITSEVVAICKLAFAEVIKPKQSVKLHIDSKDNSGRNFVTEVDLATELFLKEKLSLLLPEANFIAEETASKSKSEGLNWIIDPIDGTTNFMHHAPPYCISVALAINEDVLLGVVYELFNDEVFSAWKNGGAELNGKKISVSKNETLAQSLLVTGFPYEQNALFGPWIDLYAKLTKKTHGVRRYGAAAVDLCYVAAGRLDAYYEYNLNAWDVAAGSLIAKEAGAQVTDFFLGENFLFGKTLICSNQLLHSEVHDEMKEFLEVYREFKALN